MIVIQPKTGKLPKLSLIFLHGLGDTGHGWAPVMRMLASVLPMVRFILPTADHLPVTMNNGFRMPAWYDIYSLDRNAEVDKAGMEKSVDLVKQIIKSEHSAGVEKVVVGGFSQGGVISLLTALNTSEHLAGAICLSGYLPYKPERTLATHVPIFMGHGRDDQVVTFEYGKRSFEELMKMGLTVTFKEYHNMGHSASEQELDDMVAFIRTFIIDDHADL